MTQPTPTPDQTESTHAQLGLFDCVSIIVGIVVGVSIFKVTHLVYSNVETPWMGLGAWLLGGLLSLIGALCYAELATTYPRSGGDYVYLTRAYGSPVGFLFGWAQLAAILTGSIGAMAFTFSDYAVPLFGWETKTGVWLAVLAVVLLTAINFLGVICGKVTQNLLTVVKVVGLLAIVIAGFAFGTSSSFSQTAEAGEGGFGFAMIMVLYAFGGWNDAAFVAAEVKDRQRNIPRALILGTGGITVIYLLINAGYLMVLGFDGIRSSYTPAADAMKAAVGDWGATAITLLVMLSALGAINGLIFTGSRVYATLGADYGLFAWLGKWNHKLDAPVWSLLAQGVVSLALIIGVGTSTGQKVIDTIMVNVGFGALPWGKYFGGFNTLVAATAPVFWLFFLLTGFSVIVLRFRDPNIERSFTVPLYPLTPIVFCLTCGYMLYSAIDYAGKLTLLGFVPLALGIPLYFLSSRSTPAAAVTEGEAE
jgi:amino acid transporter